MLYSSLITAGAVLLAACDASPASKYVLHEKRKHQSWLHSSIHKRSKIDSNGVLPIRIGLAQHDLEKGHDWLMDIAHPESANYGKHWTAEEVNTAFAPTEETVQTVRDWLLNSGIMSERISVSDNKGWLAFDASVEEAETLFRTEYYEHQDKNPQKYTVGCDEYYLPEHVQAHVDYVTPGVKHQIYKRETIDLLDPVGKRFHSEIVIAPPGPPTQIDAKVVPRNCSSYVIDADCIRALYQLPALDITRKIKPENTLGIYEGIQQTYSQPDLNLFFANYAPYIPKGTRPIYSKVDGGVGPSAPAGAGGEAMLDITLAFGLVYPASINFYSVDDPYWSYAAYGFLDTMLDALDGSFCTYSAFGQKGNNDSVDPIYPDPRKSGYKGPLQCGTLQPPKVLSVSYGEGEQYLSPNYNLRQCNEWMKLALQGTTTVVSSGDSGVATNAGAYGFANGCINNTIFTPGMVIDCPYVLVVGATTIMTNVSGYSSNPEQAVYAQFAGETTPYTSGGGFSNVFPRPEYQEGAVKTFFETADPGYPYYKTTKGKNIGANGGVYNRAGRGYPDVSANGAWWHVYINETLYRYGGTSMAAPIFASFLSILNEARLNHGKSTVGFVHPTFYAHPEAFHDITVGANQGCGHEFAFNATEGWDPVTGLGTPNYNKLKDIFLSLP